MKKILIAFGTRPEAIKLSPLIHELKSKENKFNTHICVTAQHRSMLDQVLKTFEIIPDSDLNVMKKNQSISDVTSIVLRKITKILNEFKPDLVIVHGDTTTSLAASIASFYLKIPVGHIEAGLRTSNINSPFPEEFNRQVVGKVSKWHFCPTIKNKKNLLHEGLASNSIFITGNTVIDALNMTLKNISNNKKKKIILKDKFKKILLFDICRTKFILITGHRRENFGYGFKSICESIRELALKFKNIKFVYPVHLNPNVRNSVISTLSKSQNIFLIEPQDYESFCFLMKYSYLILTDSGGIQEEAPSLGKPVLVMRNETERPEAVKAGTVKLVGTSKIKIKREVSKLINNKNYYNKMAYSHNPYGDGKASKRIVKYISKII